MPEPARGHRLASSFHAVGFVSAAAMVLLGPGCASQPRRSTPIAKPDAVRTDIGADGLSVLAFAPEDGDLDGFRETYRVEAFLSNASVSAEALAIDGTFVFKLLDGDENEVYTWRVPPEDARKALATRKSVTMYSFLLTLPRPVPGQPKPRPERLYSEFTATAGGRPVQSLIGLPLSNFQ